MAILESISTFDLTSGFSTVATITTYSLLMLVMCFVGFVLWYYNFYFDWLIIIYEQIGKGSYETKFTRGRMSKKKSEKGIDTLLLFQNKEEVPPVANENIGIYKRRKCITFSRVGGILQPARIAFPNRGEILFADEFIDRQLYVSADRGIKEEWDVQKFMEKYGQALIVGGTFLGAIMFILVLGKYGIDALGILDSTANRLASIMEKSMAIHGPLN